jgi:hypothetical protein
MTPVRCGVSDHAIALATELRTSIWNQDSAIVVLNSDERCDVPYPVVYCRPIKYWMRALRSAANEPGDSRSLERLRIFGGRGAGSSCRGARKVKADGRFRIAVFFHELYASGMPWTSAFWYSRRQKRAYRRIAEACDLPITNTAFSRTGWSSGNRAAIRLARQCMPVFSQVGEAQQHVPLSDRDPVMAVFGLGGTRQRAYRSCPRWEHTASTGVRGDSGHRS